MKEELEQLRQEFDKRFKELEEKVKQRTAELYEANKELTKALEKEREINELKSRIEAALPDADQEVEGEESPADEGSDSASSRPYLVEAVNRLNGPSMKMR